MAGNEAYPPVIRRNLFYLYLKKAGLFRDLEIETSPLTPHVVNVIQSHEFL